MNKAYRLIWSKAKDAWVIVAEIVKGNGGPPPVTVKAAVVAAAIVLMAANVDALPVGQQVVNGSATFATAGNTLTVTNSPNAIINWQGFSIAAGERTTFNQQNAASAVLNRVTGAYRSDIFGMLDSNGKVFLINPNGIIFGSGSQVNVAGLVASSLGISNENFLAGKYDFTAGSTAGAVQNQGAITTTAGGMVWLISPNVENSGLITTPSGSVMLAAGQSVNMVDPLRPEIAVVVSAPTDQAVNIGTVLVQGGSAGIFGGLINQQGVINANSAVAGPGGRIFLKSTVSTTLGADSVISANALDAGDGGRVVVWSDGHTKAAGSISATGGANGGNGGFIETSGSSVRIEKSTRVSTVAPLGKTGTWLIDPSDFTIAADATGDIDGTTLSTNLETTNQIILSSDGTVNTSGNGDIFVNDAISWTSTNSLTLSALRNIEVNASISGASGTLILDAPGAVTQAAPAPITADKLELLQGTFTLLNPDNAISTLAGNVTALTLFNKQTLAIGTVGTVGLTATGEVNLTANATGQYGQDGIVVNAPISAANVTLTGTGGDGYSYSPSNSSYQGQNGGDGVVINASVAATAGTISITGTGGKGGYVNASNNSGYYYARGGNGGTGISISGGGTISASGNVTLSGTGGDGGYGRIVSNYGGNAYGGYGGNGAYITAPITSGGFTSVTGIGGFGGTATGGDASAYGFTYDAGEGFGGYGGTGIILNSDITATGAITITATGRKGGDGIDGYGGFSNYAVYASGGSGGYGFEFRSGTISGGSTISITGTGGDGGKAYGSNTKANWSENYGGNAEGGSGGDGIRVLNGTVIKTTGSSLSLFGFAGQGGDATGGLGGDSYYAGSYSGRGGLGRGGNGGTGISLNGTLGTASVAHSVYLKGEGGNGGYGQGGNGGYSEMGSGGDGGYGLGGDGGQGINVSSGSILTDSGSITLRGVGGANGYGYGGNGGGGGSGLGAGGYGGYYNGNYAYSGHGLMLNNATVESYGTGTISLYGKGGSAKKTVGGTGYYDNSTSASNGGDAYGGIGGDGIRIDGGLVSTGGAVTMQGLGGDGGSAYGGTSYGYGYGGSANGGIGGMGININAPVSSSGLITISGTGGRGGSATGGDAYNSGGYAGEGFGGDGGAGVFVNSSFSSYITSSAGNITITATGGRGGDGIDGDGGFAYIGVPARAGNGGHGFEFNSYSSGGGISTGGNIALTGIGGDGGAATGSTAAIGSGNYGGWAYGGDAGDGIRIGSITSIETTGTGKAITLSGTGGVGGGAAGGFSDGSYSGGYAYGGLGGSGIVHNGQLLNTDPAGAIALSGTGKKSGDAIAGTSGSGSAGYGRSYNGGDGVYSNSSASIMSGGALSITGSGGLAGVASGYSAYTGTNGLGVDLSVYGANFQGPALSLVSTGGGLSFSYSGSAMNVPNITTNNGQVTISGSSDVTFAGAVNAGSGSVNVTSGGSINGQAGISSINAGSATLDAQNGIGTTAPFVTAVNNLTVINDMGDINIANSGILTVGGMTNNYGSITLDNIGGVTIAGNISALYNGLGPPYTLPGSISITAHSPLTVNPGVQITAGGSIALAAGASGSVLDNLLINANVIVDAGQNILLQAGNLVTIDSTAALNGTVTIQQNMNPPPPPPPALTTQMAALLPGVNDVVIDMGKESTDLSEEDEEDDESTGEGGQDGTEFKSLPYCN